MKNSKLASLAIAGIISGSSVAVASSSNTDIVITSKKAGNKELANKCAGHNGCKGLGGCKVSEAKLKKLAKKAGVPMAKAGKAHDCAGLNECKGLGGCKVTKSKLKELKKKAAAKK